MILEGKVSEEENGVPIKRKTAPIEMPEGLVDRKLSKCARAILTFLASYDREFSKVQVGISIGYSPGTGTFSNALGELSARGFIVRGKGLRVNKTDMAAIVAEIGPVKKQKYSITTFSEKLGKCEREIYEILLKHPGRDYSKDELAALTPSRYSSGTGTFSNALGRLNSIGLIERHKGGVSLHSDLAKMI
jgi:hypothetical protein